MIIPLSNSIPTLRTTRQLPLLCQIIWRQDSYTSSGSAWVGGRSALHAINDVSMLGEVSCQTISNGVKIESAEKIIVVIHGWNPDENANHYAPKPSGVTDTNCPTRPIEDINDNDNESRNEFKWEHLIVNLHANDAIASDWKVTRYDWARDASTGPSLPGIAAADASRDAAPCPWTKNWEECWRRQVQQKST